MLDPLIVPPGSGKSSAHGQITLEVIANWLNIPLGLLELFQTDESDEPDDHIADARKKVIARRRRDHLRRLRVMETRRDA
jgi:hypothetical protein